MLSFIKVQSELIKAITVGGYDLCVITNQDVIIAYKDAGHLFQEFFVNGDKFVKTLQNSYESIYVGTLPNFNVNYLN